MGYLTPRSGTIRLADIDLAGKSTLERAQIRHWLFAGGQRNLRRIDGRENIELPTWTRTDR